MSYETPDMEVVAVSADAAVAAFDVEEDFAGLMSKMPGENN